MQAGFDVGVWAIGVDSDQSFLGPFVSDQRPQELRSRLRRRVQPGQGLEDLDLVWILPLTMRDGAAGLGRISPRVPHDLVTQLRHLQRQIVTGKIRVFGTQGRAMAADPYRGRGCPRMRWPGPPQSAPDTHLGSAAAVVAGAALLAAASSPGALPRAFGAESTRGGGSPGGRTSRPSTRWSCAKGSGRPRGAPESRRPRRRAHPAREPRRTSSL